MPASASADQITPPSVIVTPTVTDTPITDGKEGVNRPAVQPKNETPTRLGKSRSVVSATGPGNGAMDEKDKKCVLM